LEVTLTIPTRGVFGQPLEWMISSLERQTVKDFRAYFIIPRGEDALDLRARLERSDIDFKVVEQEGVGFENAMNKAIDVAGEVNINMDDDALYSPRHVESYAKLLGGNGVGMAFGRVNGRAPYLNRALLLMALNGLADGAPFSEKLGEYAMGFNSAGFMSTFKSFLRPWKGIRYNMNPMGVNMAWRGECTRKFRLVEYSRRGMLNEAYIALQCASKGLGVYEVDWINVVHPPKSSLSRGKEGAGEKLVETLMSPIIVNAMIKIDRREFERALKRVRAIYSPLFLSAYGDLLRRLMDVLERGIAENWDGKKIKVNYEALLRWAIGNGTAS
jgi:hypothetical protein